MTTPTGSNEGGCRSRRPGRRAARNIGLTALLCLCVWGAHQWCSLRREREAKALLERDYPYPACLISTGELFPLFAEHEPKIDVRQVMHGRLYIPVQSASFRRVTVHGFAFEQLAHFSYLERLTFQDCRIEEGEAFRLAANARLRSLQLWRTPVTLEQLRGIPRFARLKYLILDGQGLKGDWLRDVSKLRNVEHLVLNNADLSGGAADSLAHMKGLTCLQLPYATIDSTLGPALAGLGRLECLVLANTPFDDDGVKHLASLKRLKQLDLASTAITDDGMAWLARLPTLWRLSLNGTKVGDVGLRRLAQLPRLAGLNIQQTRATNLCLSALAAMPSLQDAWVRDTAISASVPGFVGVLDGGVWYPNEARAKEAENNSKDEEYRGDEDMETDKGVGSRCL